MDINLKLQFLKRRVIKEKHELDIKNQDEVFNKICEQDEKINDLENKDYQESYRCGKLLLDLKRGFLKYKNNNSILITPLNREIKLLEILMQKEGEVVEYIELAGVMDLSCAHEGASNTDKVLRREVQLVKKILVKLLKNAGMTVKDVGNMIRSITKSGYKLLCK